MFMKRRVVDQAEGDINEDLATFIAEIMASHPTPKASDQPDDAGRRRLRPAALMLRRATSTTVPRSRALRATIRRFHPYARRYRPQLIALGILRLLIPLAEIGAIWVFKIAVDQVFVPASLDKAPLVFVLLGLTTIAVAGLSYVESVLDEWVSGRILLDARRDLMSHMLDVRPDFYDRHALGDLLTRLSGDVGAIGTLVATTTRDVFGHVVRAAALLTIIFVLSWRLALAALVVGPFFGLLSRFFARRTKVTSRERRRRGGEIGAAAEDILANVPLIQSHGTKQAELDRFDDHGQALFRVDMVAARLRALYQPAVDGMELVGAISVISLGTIELDRGRMTLGGLFVFMAFLNQLFSPIRALGRLGTSLYSAAASAERVIELLDVPAHAPDPPDALPVIAQRGDVEFKSVSFTYPGAERASLSGVSFRLEPGKVVALVGPSGAGKSTVVRLLMRWYEPTAGTIRFDGDDIRALCLDEYRERIALVPQDSPMVDRTIAENIAYGLPDATDDEITAAATLADAHSFIDEFPDGYATSVGQRGRRLSGGQRQRIALARALLRDAPLLILDEPTSGLDAGSTDRIHEPIHRLMDNRATLLVSHNLRMVHEADEILVLDAGRIVERGTHNELRAIGGLYETLYQASLPAAERDLPTTDTRR